jgi:tRNA nucleotidyltransferase (CCA-adding enzyme)
MAPRIELTEKEETLRTLLLDVSQYISETEHVSKPQLRFTGGWVRDKLLGSASHDIDVGIDNMTGEKFGLGLKRYLEDRERSAKYDEHLALKIAKIEANPDKSKHLETATTNILGLDIDLVNLRKETYTKDSRNPQIEPATPEEDALRRDATVNALFYNLQSGEVEDFTKRGLEDMKQKIIRTPLDPYQTFEDDPLRILRCIRFATRLGYRIDPLALKCMGDKSIADSLRVKISRERVGVEIEKTLKGPDPRTGLEIIEEQSLYETIFTNPQRSDLAPEDGAHWARSYNMLSKIIHDPPEPNLYKLRSYLITEREDIYTAWILAALLPWGQKTWSEQLKLTSKAKRVFPAAAVVAREGLKVENKLLEDIVNAIDHFVEVKTIVAPYLLHQDETESKSPPSVIHETEADKREHYGMTIRRWGPHWRSTVMYALLVLVQRNADPAPYIGAFSAWLAKLKDLDLLEVYTMKPMVNGGELMRELDRPSGEWLARALDQVVRWQLRNPGSTSKDRLIEDVRRQVE